jgi:hypothetical protein
MMMMMMMYHQDAMYIKVMVMLQRLCIGLTSNDNSPQQYCNSAEQSLLCEPQFRNHLYTPISTGVPVRLLAARHHTGLAPCTLSVAT